MKRLNNSVNFIFFTGSSFYFSFGFYFGMLKNAVVFGKNRVFA